MKKVIHIKAGFLFICFFILCLLLYPSFSFAQKKVHSVYFEGSDYELHIYRIYGKEPGKTLLLIGGIQGDEPGGFLSADHYADISLARGNLIVVPRANFQSIILNRRKINEDMNRKFADDPPDNYEKKVVEILKKLISESDCLLNLHDGSGFYSDKWEGPDRNPKRFGQSIIADSETYTVEETGRMIELGNMARVVADEINRDIQDPGLHFHFNNHKTKEDVSIHKEQRKSATYYALYSCGIPAYGIETSKSLSMEDKVRHHNLAINSFMKLFDIVPEMPGMNLDPPQLKYLVVSVNDSTPVAVRDNEILYVNQGDSVMVTHIEANYERGLTADVVGHGSISDLRRKFMINEPTKIIVRKDYFPCGSIRLEIDEKSEEAVSGVSSKTDIRRYELSKLLFKTRVNGAERIDESGSSIKLVKGDRFEILDIISGRRDRSNLVVNFKGYICNSRNNTGEDRGYVINTGKDLLSRYSLDRKGNSYQILVSNKNKTVGNLFVDLADPCLKYVIIKKGEDGPGCFYPGDTIDVEKGKAVKLIDINTNVEGNSGVVAFITGAESIAGNINMDESVMISDMIGAEGKIPSGCRIEIRLNDILLGSIYLRLI
ncbi:MAG: hypothetical protein EHM85_03745 [Desulfobacteraceae bacterium]|nr:MAG: hypothetical protein EHM85_03745 [Desulfobacteraceae bacterium]